MNDQLLDQYLNTINSISANPCLLKTYVSNNINQMEQVVQRVANNPDLAAIYGDRINTIRAANPTGPDSERISWIMKKVQDIALWLLDNGFEMGANILMSAFGC